MAQVLRNVQNNFIAGLKTEYTGLNFPENAATSCSNMDFSLIGDVSRRGGIDYEANAFVDPTYNFIGNAINSYKWNNVGGDGETQIVVFQNGHLLSYYLSSHATISNPLSTTFLSQTDVSQFVAAGGSFDPTVECQFADGNGYLFVFHPTCDPFYVTFNSANNGITANVITIQIRDFTGIPDSLSASQRPNTLSNEHHYNLVNQGWSSTKSNWTSTSENTNKVNTNVNIQWTLDTTPTINVGDVVAIVALTRAGYINVMSGTVFSWAAGSRTLVVSIANLGVGGFTYLGQSFSVWQFYSNNGSLISQFQTAAGVYPSNSDIWWLYKSSSGLVNFAGLLGTIPVSGEAPLGSNILNAFNQNRNVSVGTEAVSGITTISTTVRPRTGCWFQGRVFYSGVDGNFQPTGDAPFTTWTENIYFSQIVEQTQDFGTCYQTNDPTSEQFFDLLPSDGGVIVIQGSGSIYKLFPVQNGLLVFASNGIWFITGSTGIGFAANDYTVTKISGIQSISGTSFVNVLGWPYFWNVEGIYTVVPTQAGGGLNVEPLALGNILTFYQEIPVSSKLYARGDYDPINYQLQWLYRSTTEASINNRYQYDSILVHNTIELPREARGQILGKVFYPYSIKSSSGFPNVYGIRYVQNPTAGSSVPTPLFKYLVFSNSKGFTFAEENNFTTYTDWLTFNGTGIDASAFIITGYNLKPQHHPYYGYYAQALVKHSPSYINVFIRNTANNGYLFNSIWDWANDTGTGKFSSQQQVINSLTSNKYQFITRRHRVRGRGFSMQLQFQSLPNLPMDIIGWSVFESVMEAP